MAADGAKVLAIMDGFDKPLSEGALTRNLWDQLRELALRPSLRLVTASRRKLSELIRHPDAQTSDFWNIFNPTPVRVGCFDGADLATVVASLSNISLEAGAHTELMNATNGFPVLTLSVLNTVCDHGADLPSHPEVFLGNVHGILEQVLTQIWQAECWSKDTEKPHIPSEWFSVWASNGDRMDDWRTRFPEGGQRLRLLDLMTGTQRHDRLARFVTKNAYVLANAVQGFRDFGVHPKSSRIEVGTGYAALYVCIELAAALARELPRTR